MTSAAQATLFADDELPRAPRRPGALSGCGMNLLHPLHNAWKDAIYNCERPDRRNFPSYGGKGIRVCPRWRFSFAAFCADMEPSLPGPASSCWLERINKRHHYEPQNCRWRLITHPPQFAKRATPGRMTKVRPPAARRGRSKTRPAGDQRGFFLPLALKGGAA